MEKLVHLIVLYTSAVDAASQWWSNERMMVYFKQLWSPYSFRQHFSIFQEHFTIINEHFTIILAWSIPSFTHFTIIEKLHRLKCSSDSSKHIRSFIFLFFSFLFEAWYFISDLPIVPGSAVPSLYESTDIDQLYGTKLWMT